MSLGRASARSLRGIFATARRGWCWHRRACCPGSKRWASSGRCRRCAWDACAGTWSGRSASDLPTPASGRCLVHLLGACAALQDRLGPESAALLDAVEVVLHQRHRASNAIEGFQCGTAPLSLRPQGRHPGLSRPVPCLVQSAHPAVGATQRDQRPPEPDRTAGPRLALAARLPALASARIARGRWARPHLVGHPDPEHRVPRDGATRMCKDESSDFDRCRGNGRRRQFVVVKPKA